LDLAVRRPPLRLTIPEVFSEVATFELRPDMLQLPGQFPVNALDVRPPTVALRFAPVDRRTIPVRVRVNDMLGQDWALVDSLVAQPAFVRVAGPPEQVEGKTRIF